MLSNWHMDEVIRMLRDLAQDPKLSDEERAYFKALYDQALFAQDEYDSFILDLQTQLYRNPAFPGDLVGWLADDFDDDDDDDDTDSEGDQKR